VEKERQPMLVLLPGKSHGQRSLAGESPWGCRRRPRGKEGDELGDWD